MRVSILTNGPGELWGWVRPVAVELRLMGHSVSLWLLPCPFASGHEREAASAFGTDKLEGPLSAVQTWRELALEETDVVLQLGGDLMFGSRLAASAKVPLICYAYGPQKGMENVKTFTAWPKTAANMPGAVPIGDLVKDALALDVKQSPKGFGWPEIAGSPRLLLFPGSRPAIRNAALSWLSEVVERLKADFPRLRVATLFSPFVPEIEIAGWQNAGLNPRRAGAGVAMPEADYAITLPGTNTIEMMHCGLPALVLAPVEFLKHVPVSGLKGFAVSLPFIGPKIRMAAARRIISRRKGFLSWPNLLAGRELMDELYGDVTPSEVAYKTAQALGDPEYLRKKKTALLELSGPESGAAKKLCEILQQGLGPCTN